MRVSSWLLYFSDFQFESKICPEIFIIHTTDFGGPKYPENSVKTGGLLWQAQIQLSHWPFDSAAAAATKVTPPKNYNTGEVRKHFVCLFCMCECDHYMFISDWSL